MSLSHYTYVFLKPVLKVFKTTAGGCRLQKSTKIETTLYSNKIISFDTVKQFSYLAYFNLYSGGSRISQMDGANAKGGGANLLLWPTSPQNCMKIKKMNGVQANKLVITS